MLKWNEIKIWHLILFNVFFSFGGSFIGYLLNSNIVDEYWIKVIAKLSFIGFLILLLPALKKSMIGLYRSNWFSAIAVGVLLGLVAWLVMVLHQPTLQLLLDHCNLGICDEILQNYYTVKGEGTIYHLDTELLLVMTLMFVILGPLKEELLYRAAMTRILSQRHNILKAALIVAIIFGLFHLRYFITSFCYSLMLTALMLHYRNIIPAIVTHGTYNGMIYFLLPPKVMIGHHSTLGMLEVLSGLFLLVTMIYYSCRVIRRNSMDWL